MNKCFRTIVVALISIIMIGCDKNEYTDKIEVIKMYVSAETGTYHGAVILQ